MIGRQRCDPNSQRLLFKKLQRAYHHPRIEIVTVAFSRDHLFAIHKQTAEIQLYEDCHLGRVDLPVGLHLTLFRHCLVGCIGEPEVR